MRVNVLEAVATAGLVIGLTTVALGSDPVNCPAGVVTINGQTFPYDAKTCSAGERCGVTINIGTDGVVESVHSACLPAHTPIPS